MKKENEEDARLILAEIIDGYSKISNGAVTVYFKHPVLKNSILFAKREEELKEIASNNGFPTEEELLNKAKESGKWNQEDEDKLENLTFEISAITRALEKISDPGMKKTQEVSLEKTREKFKILQEKRNSFIQFSQEAYVWTRVFKETTIESFFLDKELRKPIDPASTNFEAFYLFYQQRMNSLSNQNNLLRATFQGGFFDLFFLFPDLSCVFNANGPNLTVFQKEILMYGKILTNKMVESDLPKEILDDPIKIWNYKGKNTPPEQQEGLSDLKAAAERKGGAEKLDYKDFLGD